MSRPAISPIATFSEPAPGSWPEVCADCGVRLFCPPARQASAKTLAENKEDCPAALPEKVLLQIALLQYGLPLLGFLTGIFTVHFAHLTFPPLRPELLMFGAGLAGVLLAAGASRCWARHLARRFQAKLL